jgi:hypothetical protein
MSTDPPPPPADLQRRGAAFWSRVVATHALMSGRLEILAEAARTLDPPRRVRAELRAQGLTTVG